jgi:predicted nucleotidyltransferase
LLLVWAAIPQAGAPAGIRKPIRGGGKAVRRAEALQVLTRSRDKLREMGVRHLALFGSVVRDEATDASDVDVLVELDEAAGYFRFLDIQDYLQETLDVPKVDLVLRNSLFEDLKDGILREAVDVL